MLHLLSCHSEVVTHSWCLYHSHTVRNHPCLIPELLLYQNISSWIYVNLEHKSICRFLSTNTIKSLKASGSKDKVPSFSSPLANMTKRRPFGIAAACRQQNRVQLAHVSWINLVISWPWLEQSKLSPSPHLLHSLQCDHMYASLWCRHSWLSGMGKLGWGN